MGMRHLFSRSPRPAALSLALGVLVFGCAPATTAPPTAAVTPAASSQAPAGTLHGHVTFPADLVDAQHVIPTGIGRVIPTGQGRYRVSALSEELPVSGATVSVRHPLTHAPWPDVASARTGQDGRFSLAGVPAGQNVLIDVTFTLPGSGEAVHLLAVGRAAADAAGLGVSWRSTAVVTTAILAGGLNLGTATPEALRDAEAREAERVAALEPPRQAGAIRATITAAATALLTPLPGALLSPTPQPSGQSSAPATLLPSPLASVVGAVTDPVTGAIASAVPAVTAPVTEAVEEVGATTEAVTDEAVEPVIDTVEGTVNSTLGLLPSPNPSRSPLLPGLL